MFIWTAKLNKKKAAGVLAAAVVLCAAAAAVTLAGRQAQASAMVSPKGIRSEEDRVAYLQEWGWQVNPQAALVEELELPAAGDVEHFDPEEAIRRADRLMEDYDGVLARLREKSKTLAQAALENERRLLEMLERAKP